jgi:hypothetical protein
MSWVGSLSEIIGLLPVVAPSTEARLSQSFGVSYQVACSRLYNIVLTEDVGTAPSLDTAWGVVVEQVVRISPALIPIAIYQLELSQGVGSQDNLVVAWPLAVSEGVGVAPSLLVAQAATVAERLGLLPLLETIGTFQVDLLQGFAVHPSLAKFLSGDVAETVGIAPELVAIGYGYRTVSEGVAVAPEITPQFLLNVTLSEGVDISVDEAVNGIFNGGIAEAIVIKIGYLAPDGSFSTWVMNTRTAAVTEYSNYEFNSFARSGDHYIGASSNGLYELAGDDDDGTDIVATLAGGFMQFGGTHLSRLKEAYIAARGEGRFVLKIETREGDMYVYQVDTHDGRSTKVNMGKGQRSRYFAFELTSAGQDFDLDTLEFVPIVLQRRV